MSSRPIYLDSHATTPVDERVLAAMLPFFTEHLGLVQVLLYTQL
jgi:cysteine desulfurase